MARPSDPEAHLTGVFGEGVPAAAVQDAYGRPAGWAAIGTTAAHAKTLPDLDGYEELIAGNRAGIAVAAAVRATVPAATWTAMCHALIAAAVVGADGWTAYTIVCDAIAPGTDPVTVPVPPRLLWTVAHELDTTTRCMPDDWPGVHTYGSPRFDGLFSDGGPPMGYIGTRWGHTLDLHTAWADLYISTDEADRWSSRGYHPEDAAGLLSIGHHPDHSTLLDDWMTEDTLAVYLSPDDLWCSNVTREAINLRSVGCPGPWRAAYLRHLA